MSSLINRFVGVKSYPDDGQYDKLFFGRDEEINEILNSVFSLSACIIYGASGVGKTSLINCGLKPEIINSNELWPIKISFLEYEKYDRNLFKMIYYSLIKEQEKISLYINDKKHTKKTALEKDYFSRLQNSMRLPEWINTISIVKSNQVEKSNYSLVIIFDQFESLYTFDRKTISNTSKEILELIIPTNNEELYFNRFKYFINRKPVIIISVVEAELGKLDYFTKISPSLRNNQYRIQGLTKNTSIDILNNISEYSNGYKFTTPNFKIGNILLEKILEHSPGNFKNEYSPFFLQLFGSLIEDKIKNLEGFKDGDTFTIDLIKKEEFDNHIFSYYINSIRSFGVNNYKLARSICQDKLITTEGNILAQDVSDLNIDNNEIIKLLLEKRLIVEFHIGSEDNHVIQLSHSKLAKAIHNNINNKVFKTLTPLEEEKKKLREENNTLELFLSEITDQKIELELEKESLVSEIKKKSEDNIELENSMKSNNTKYSNYFFFLKIVFLTSIFALIFFFIMINSFKTEYENIKFDKLEIEKEYKETKGKLTKNSSELANIREEIILAKSDNKQLKLGYKNNYISSKIKEISLLINNFDLVEAENNLEMLKRNEFSDKSNLPNTNSKVYFEWLNWYVKSLSEKPLNLKDENGINLFDNWKEFEFKGSKYKRTNSVAIKSNNEILLASRNGLIALIPPNPQKEITKVNVGNNSKSEIDNIIYNPELNIIAFLSGGKAGININGEIAYIDQSIIGDGYKIAAMNFSNDQSFLYLLTIKDTCEDTIDSTNNNQCVLFIALNPKDFKIGENTNNFKSLVDQWNVSSLSKNINNNLIDLNLSYKPNIGSIIESYGNSIYISLPNYPHLIIGSIIGNPKILNKTENTYLESQISSMLVNEDMIVLANNNNRISIWNKSDTMNSNEVFNKTYLDGYDTKYRSLALLPNNRIVAGGENGIIRIWDLNSRKVIRILEGHNRAVIKLYINSSNTELTSVDIGGKILNWNINFENYYELIDIGDKAPRSVALSNDLLKIAIGTKTGHIIYKELNDDNKIVNSIEKKIHDKAFKNQKRDYWVYDVLFTNDGKSILSGGYDGKIQKWTFDNNEFEQIVTSNNWITSLSNFNKNEIDYIFSSTQEINNNKNDSNKNNIGLFYDTNSLSLSNKYNFLNTTNNIQPSIYKIHDNGEVSNLNILFPPPEDKILYSDIYEHTSEDREYLSVIDSSISGLRRLHNIKKHNGKYSLEETENINPKSLSKIYQTEFGPNGAISISLDIYGTLVIRNLDEKYDLFQLKLPIPNKINNEVYDFDFKCYQANCKLVYPSGNRIGLIEFQNIYKK